MTHFPLRSILPFALVAGLLAVASPQPLHATAAPAWSLKDVSGKTVQLSDFKGKIVILDFWATWCPPCRAEIPNFIALQDKYAKQGVTVVGLSVDQGGLAAVGPFVTKTKINYPVVLGDLDLASTYGVQGLPTTFVIDQQGNIAATHVGGTEPSAFEADIQKLLGGK